MEATKRIFLDLHRRNEQIIRKKFRLQMSRVTGILTLSAVQIRYCTGKPPGKSPGKSRGTPPYDNLVNLGHFFLHTFSSEKTPLMRHPDNTAKFS